MTELKPEVKREAMIALCRQQNYPAACSCMAEGGIGFGKLPGALTCRDTYEEIIDVLAPILTRAAPRTDGDDGEQPAPYRCKHGCERDELMDRITALRAEVEESKALGQHVLMWLGVYRDHLPAEAIKSLQDIAALGAKP